MSTFSSYLSIQEQQDVLNRLKVVQDSSPLREKLFLENGEYVSAATLLGSSLVFWRSGFRAFSLFKYSKGRVTTLLLATSSCLYGALTHSMFVKDKLASFNRKEDILYYGIRAITVHQHGLLTTFVASTCGTFMIAYKYGIIPIPEPMYKAGNRQVAFNYFKTKLQPYAKTMLWTCLASSTIMFLVGMLEYKESKRMLSKLNRKTLNLRE